MSKVLEAHWAAVVLVVFAGVLVIAPYILMIVRLDGSYNGYYPLAADAETHYLARINNFAVHQGIGNPYIYELRYEPSPFLTISEPIAALPTMFFDVPVPVTNLLYKFLMPSLATAGLYLLMYALIGDRLWAAASSFFIVIAGPLLNVPDLRALLTWNLSYWGFLQFARPINPQFSFIFFLVFLYAYLTYLKEPNGKKVVFIGLLWGIALYVYLYTFLFITALMAVTLFVQLLRRRSVKMIGYSVLCACGVGSFGLYNIYQISTHPWYLLLASESGLSLTHMPILSWAGLITSLVLFVTFRKGILTWQNPTGVFLALSMLTTWVVINQQVLTGRALQTGHFHWYFNVPIYALTLAVCIYQWMQYKAALRYKKYLVFLTIFVTMAFGYLVQSSSYGVNYAKTVATQRLLPVLGWLNSHTARDAVVLTNDQVSGLVPIFSHNYIAWNEYTKTYLTDPARLWYDSSEKILQNLIEFRKQYRLDYILWDKKVDPDWAKYQLSTFIKETEMNGIVVYRVS